MYHQAEENKKAVSNSPRKSPGLDGFPVLFFCEYWGIIQHDLLSFFLRIPFKRETSPGHKCNLPNLDLQKKSEPLQLALYSVPTKSCLRYFPSIRETMHDSADANQFAFVKDKTK